MFSIVIPIYNEAPNIKKLTKEINISLASYKNYEIIFVDDASIDNSVEELEKIKNNKIKIQKNNINKGQSYSIHKGIKMCSFETIVTMDGDGQNDPSDIPKILEYYLSNKKIKLVGGIRLKRQDNLIKIISSKVANLIRAKILKDGCNDTGCSLKVFDRKIFLLFPYFNGIHRFLPALFSGYGYNTDFINVNHRKRKFGKSKYGTMNRLFKGIRDIIRVRKIIRSKK